MINLKVADVWVGGGVREKETGKGVKKNIWTTVSRTHSASARRLERMVDSHQHLET